MYTRTAPSTLRDRQWLLSRSSVVTPAIRDAGRGERDECQMPGTLDRLGQGPLVLGARARLATSLDLESIGDIAAQGAEVLVVNVRHVIHAERADSAPGVKPASAPSRSTRSASPARPRRTGEWPCRPGSHTRLSGRCAGCPGVAFARCSRNGGGGRRRWLRRGRSRSWFRRRGLFHRGRGRLCRRLFRCRFVLVSGHVLSRCELLSMGCALTRVGRLHRPVLLRPHPHSRPVGLRRSGTLPGLP